MRKSRSSKVPIGGSNLLESNKENFEIRRESKIKSLSKINLDPTTERRRSQRLCKLNTHPLNHEMSITPSLQVKSSTSKTKASRPSRCMIQKKSVKYSSKSAAKVSKDEEPSESEISHDTNSDEDWKPDLDRRYASEVDSEAGSLDDFRSIPSPEVTPKKVRTTNSYSSLSLKSRNTMNHKTRSSKSVKKSTLDINEGVNCDLLDESDSDNPSDWEEVDDRIIPEEDYLKDLLDPTNGFKLDDSATQSKVPFSLEVPLLPVTKKVTKKDPKVLEQMANKRRLRELYYAMHSTHLMCILAFTRRLNKMCDSPLYRALGISLLHRSGILYDNMGGFVAKFEWRKEHLEACIISVLIKQDPAVLSTSKSPETSKLTLLVRLRENRATEMDCTILLVAALRALAFDVRIVIGINPYPIRPDSRFAIATKTNKTPKSESAPIKVNRQIISSGSDGESEPEKLKRHSKPKSGERKQMGIFCFAEVFLPDANQWIIVDPSPPNGCVGRLGSDKSWLYCIGIASTLPADSDSVPYVGRNPVDLTARYDPDWCIRSRPDRLPAEKWLNLLNFQRSFFDRDALFNRSIVNSSENPITYLRDLQDERVIHEKLLSEPIPERLSDLKNHPLYVVSRHLLKYQVIYPLDAVPLGFFRDEPVYSRDCVKLCHNRESWLKEAMVVKPLEKPVKIVKARPSMKRKLLQGFDDKPQTVELFGPWQVEPYKPPKAENGIVPRGPHGTVDLFKPCMLPIGCAHVCLTGIHHIARKLGIDCVPAVVGWTFHGAGWAHPKQEGYVVCKESVPALVDAWHQTRMNAAKEAAEDRTQRALENWCRLVRGLFLWHRVKAQFALAPLHSNTLEDNKSSAKLRKATRSRVKPDDSEQIVNVSGPDDPKSLHNTVPTVDRCMENSTSGGWQRLSQLNEADIPIIPIPVLGQIKKRPKRVLNKSTSVKRRRKKASTPSSSEVSEEDLPSSDSDFV